MEEGGVAGDEDWLHVSGYAGGEVRCAVGVEWDCDDSAEEAAVEGGYPFGAVLRPEDEAVAGLEVAGGEESGETPGLRC